MLVLITYDVNTESKTGASRLRKIAKLCTNYGQRVQNSVFECNLNAAQFCELKNKLIKVIDKDLDSLRFYNLGNSYKSKIEHVGAKASYDAEDVLLI